MTKEEKEKHLALFAALRYIQNYRSRVRSLRRDKAEYIAVHERNGWPVKRSTVYDFDAEIHYAEAEVRCAREALALYRRAQELQALHGRRTTDNLYPVTL